MGKVIVKWPWVIACVMAAAWLLLQVPSPGKFLTDADWGHQLAGANQILFGEHPNIDWRSTYGPLTFYASALFQVLFHGAPLGEIVLMLLGYFASYMVMFRLLKSASGRYWIALGILAFALLVVPRTYKHYILLWPLLSLGAIWLYMKAPSLPRLWLLAAIIAITGLFRPDYGAYTTLAAIIGFAACEGNAGKRLPRILGLVGAIVICASPWLIFAGIHHGIGDYVRDNFLISVQHAEGSALPFPRPNVMLGFSSDDNVRFFGLVTFLLVPACSAVILWFSRKDVPRAERDRVIVAIALAQFCLIQGLHKIDPGHFFQAIPMTFIPLGWMLGRIGVGWESVRVKAFAVVAGVLLLFPFLCTVKMALAKSRRPETFSYLEIADDLSTFTSKEAVLAAIPAGAPQHWIVQTMDYVRANTKPGEKITVLPAFPNLIYFSNHPFSGGQMVIVPGYFTDDEDQQRFLKGLRRDQVSVVVEEIDYPLDGIEERRMSKFAKPIRTYLDTEYRTVAHYGPVDIKRPIR